MQKAYHSIFIFLLILSSYNSFAQTTGNLVFNDTILHEIRIQFNYDTWFDTLEHDFTINFTDTGNLYPEREFVCNMNFDNIQMDSIGMREKGNFSNISAPYATSNGLKKPFKLVFDSFKKQKFDNLKEVNLNNSTDDPSFVREELMYKLIRDQGIPACRTAYAKLYVNDVYWGVYELVEDVDKTFLKDQFGAANNGGNLYKTNRSAGVDLSWLGTDPKPYQTQGLDMKISDSLKSWDKFLHFVDVVNHTPRGNLEEELPKVFDVESFLHILAVEVLCYSWDSYWGNGNNFYLYEHPDGRIRWIPWDFNESFTTKEGLISYILPQEGDIFLSTHIDRKPLLKAIFCVRKWQDEYLDIICDLCTNEYWPPLLSPQLHKWQDLIRDALAEDTNALASMVQFNYSLTTDMDNAYNIPILGGVIITVPGLLPYIEKQREWAVGEIKFQGGSCALADVIPSEYPMKVYPNPSTDVINMSWDKFTTDIYVLKVYNSYGDLVINSKWIVNDTKTQTLNISALPTGLYIVRKQDVDGFWADAKFIKQ